jgi:methionyl-tRNA formyltransferase
MPLQYSSGVKGCDTEHHVFTPCVRIEQGFTMRIIFMGTSEFALPSLSRLVESEHEVVAVYTQPDRPAGRGKHPTPPPVKVWALERGLPALQPEKVSAPEEVARLAEFRPDFIVAAAYGQILRERVLQVPSNGAINIHPSLLPRHRGASPVAAAILAGDEETGVTVMLMSLALDEGPILAQRRIPVAPKDTTGTLTDRLAVIGSELLMETLPHFADGTIQPQPQDPSGVTYAPMVYKEDALIDWKLPATEIWRRVRAYNPWPGAFTYLDGLPLRILEAWPLTENSEEPPGTVVSSPRSPEERLKGAFAIQTGAGLLAILVVQKAGRRPLPATDFLRGERDLIGRSLG